MSHAGPRPLWARLLTEHGIVLALLLLCAWFSFVTLAEQNTGGAAGGEELAHAIVEQEGTSAKVLIVGGHGRGDGPFAVALVRDLEEAGVTVLGRSQGHPRDARKLLEKLLSEGKKP